MTNTDPNQAIAQRRFGRVLLVIGALEIVGAVVLAMILKEPWAPFLVLAAVPTFGVGLWSIRAANKAEAPR